MRYSRNGGKTAPLRCGRALPGRERERERAALSATVVVSQKEKRLTRDLLGRKTRAREPKPEDEEDQGTQTTELS